MQTTLVEASIVSSRVALLLRSAEIKLVFFWFVLLNNSFGKEKMRVFWGEEKKRQEEGEGFYEIEEGLKWEKYSSQVKSKKKMRDKDLRKKVKEESEGFD